MKKNKGITLIALIVIIGIMLIAVGVTVATISKNNLTKKVEGEKELAHQEGKTGAEVTYQDGKNVETENEENSVVSTKKTGWNEEKGVNYPELASGMKAIYWDESGNEIIQGDEKFDWNKWFDYKAQETGEDGTSRWANAKTEDGSYWVWIPRFEYKITESTNKTPSNRNAGTIDVKFISTGIKDGSEGYTTTDGITKSADGYIIHPAFTSNVNVGGFGKELSGFWVAKYEMSMEESTDGTNWNTVELLLTNEHGAVSDEERGNIATTNAGNSNYIRAVSKPGVRSWRWINVANAYTNSYYYDRSKDSHLIKNSEWGAIAYLTHSQYGRNGKEVTLNETKYITGGETGSAYKTNVEQSSTGNITGIYDLSGAACEYVAVFNTDGDFKWYEGNGYKDASGKHFGSVGGKSTKYATAYSNSTETIKEDFTVGTVSITGDAIEEIYISGDRGWFNDYSYFINLNNVAYYRGCYYRHGDGAGIFYSGADNGMAGPPNSFRVVCAY